MLVTCIKARYHNHVKCVLFMVRYHNHWKQVHGLNVADELFCHWPY